MDGTMNMRCSNGYTSTIIFRKDRQTEVYGSIMDNHGVLVVKLIGYYDRFLQKLVFYYLKKEVKILIRSKFRIE